MDSSRRRLLDAIRANDLPLVQSIVRSESLDLSQSSSRLGAVLLLSAIKQDRSEIVNWLLYSQNCPVNRDTSGFKRCDTALHAAVAGSCNDDLVAGLLERGALLDVRNPSGESSILVACKAGNVEALGFLLRAIDAATSFVVDLPDDALHGPLHAAVERGCSESVRLLLSHGANVEASTAKTDREGFTPLHLATLANNREIAELLLNGGAEVDAAVGNGEQGYYNMDYDGFTALHLAAKVDKEGSVLGLLLERGADVNASAGQVGVTPMHVAVRAKNERAVALLSERSADLSTGTKEGKSLLHSSVRSGWCEFAEKLLRSQSVSVDSIEDENVLHAAVEVNNLDMVRLLLASGLDVDSRNRREQTPLHLAVERSAEIAKLLLESGADVDRVDEDNRTPLALAVRLRDLEMVSLILSYRPSVSNLANREAFSYAIDKFYYYKKIAGLLIEYGFREVCCGDRYNVPVLHYAVQNLNKHQLDVTKKLLRHVDVNVVDDNGKLAVFYIPKRKKMTSYCRSAKDHCKFRHQTCDYHKNKIIGNLLKIYVKHVVCLSSADKTVDPDNWKVLSKFKNFIDLRDSCLLEISKMKDEKIFENVSFYDLLVKNCNGLVAYGRNKDLIEAFKASDFVRKFPLYSDSLIDQFDEARRKARLVESSALAFDELTNRKLTRVAIDKIFEFLNASDLNSVIFTKLSDSVDNNNADVPKAKRIKVS